MTPDNDDNGGESVPPPHPELERLDPLLGTWRSEEHTRDTILAGTAPKFRPL